MIRREARTRQGGLAGKGVEARRAATARPLLAVVAVTVRRRRGGQRRRGGRIRRPRRVGRRGRRDEVRARVELARELERVKDDDEDREQEGGEHRRVAARHASQPHVEGVKEVQARSDAGRRHARRRQRALSLLFDAVCAAQCLAFPRGRDGAEAGEGAREAKGGEEGDPAEGRAERHVDEQQPPRSGRAAVLVRQPAEQADAGAAGGEACGAPWRGGGLADVVRGAGEQPPGGEEDEDDEAAGRAGEGLLAPELEHQTAERRRDQRHRHERARRVVDVRGDGDHEAEQGEHRDDDRGARGEQQQLRPLVDLRHHVPHYLVHHPRRAGARRVGGVELPVCAAVRPRVAPGGGGGGTPA
mmetsp:Transcript_14717/g.47258  ORF Transcript_14717/g.47258 Transcript_14717/m.47258 type:complete len:358 (-) Transcript_14717:22-1095(-)